MAVPMKLAVATRVAELAGWTGAVSLNVVLVVMR
jgi:hypothetical protein